MGASAKPADARKRHAGLPCWGGGRKGGGGGGWVATGLHCSLVALLALSQSLPLQLMGQFVTAETACHCQTGSRRLRATKSDT